MGRGLVTTIETIYLPRDECRTFGHVWSSITLTNAELPAEFLCVKCWTRLRVVEVVFNVDTASRDRVLGAFHISEGDD